MRKQHLTVWMTLTVMMLGLSGCSNSKPSKSLVLANPQNYSAWRVLKNEPQISTFAHLIKSSGLRYAMKMPGNYTIFVPSDAAFKDLPKATLKDLTNKLNRNELRTLLWHHIALYQITPASAPKEKMGDSQCVSITSNGTKLMSIDGTKIIGGPIYTRDATIYIIDKVLTPSAMK